MKKIACSVLKRKKEIVAYNPITRRVEYERLEFEARLYLIARRFPSWNKSLSCKRVEERGSYCAKWHKAQGHIQSATVTETEKDDEEEVGREKGKWEVLVGGCRLHPRLGFAELAYHIMTVLNNCVVYLKSAATRLQVFTYSENHSRWDDIC